MLRFPEFEHAPDDPPAAGGSPRDKELEESSDEFAATDRDKAFLVEDASEDSPYLRDQGESPYLQDQGDSPYLQTEEPDAALEQDSPYLQEDDPEPASRPAREPEPLIQPPPDDPYNLDDYDPKNADLAGMYVKKTGEEKLKVNYGGGAAALDDDAGFNWTPVIVIFVLLLIFVAISGPLLLVKREMVSANGQMAEVPLGQWMLAQASMDERQRLLQEMSNEERAVFITLDRIERVHRGVQAFVNEQGTVPSSLAPVVEAGFVDPEDSRDGFSYTFRVRELGSGVEIVSPGPDGAFDTPADISLGPNGVHMPAQFENKMFEAGFTR